MLRSELSFFQDYFGNTFINLGWVSFDVSLHNYGVILVFKHEWGFCEQIITPYLNRQGFPLEREHRHCLLHFLRLSNP